MDIDELKFPEKEDNSVLIAETEEEYELRYEAIQIFKNRFYFKNLLKQGKIHEIYLIDKEWWKKWKEYSSYGKIKRSIIRWDYYSKMTARKYEVDPFKHPGEISNQKILKDLDEFLNNKDKEDPENIVLRDNNNHDNTKYFKAIDKESWDILQKKYSGGPTIHKINVGVGKDFHDFDCFLKNYNVMFMPAVYDVNFDPNKIQVYNSFISEKKTVLDLKKYLVKAVLADQNIMNLIGIPESDLNTYKETQTGINCFLYRFNSTFTSDSFKALLFDNLSKLGDKDEQINAKGKMILTKETDWIFQLGIHDSTTTLLCEFTKESEKFIAETGTLYCQIRNAGNYMNDQATSPENQVDNMDIDDHKINNGPKNTQQNIGNPLKQAADQNEFSYSPESPTPPLFSTEADTHFDLTPKVELDPEDNLKGLVGLVNLGNTCFMNSGLQCLSNSYELTEYFLKDYYVNQINIDNPIGSQGRIANAYADLVKKLWYGKENSVRPIQVKSAISGFQNMFIGYHQHDSHELLTFLLDGLHEDLNKVLKKPYVEQKDDDLSNTDEVQAELSWSRFLMRNQSIILELFYGLFKSTLKCPNEECKNISRSFEPFITLSLPFKSKKNKKTAIDVVFIFSRLTTRPLGFKMLLPEGTSERLFRKKISNLLGIGENTFIILKTQNNNLCEFDDKKYFSINEFLGYTTDIVLFQIPPEITKENVNYDEIGKNLRLEIKDKDEAEINEDFHLDVQISNANDEAVNPESSNPEDWIQVRMCNYSYEQESAIFSGFYHEEEETEKVKPNNDLNLPLFTYINKNWTTYQVWQHFLKYFIIIFAKLKEAENEAEDDNNEEEKEKEEKQEKEPINPLGEEFLKEAEEKYFPDINKKLVETKKKFKIKKKDMNSLEFHKQLGFPFIIIFQKIKNKHSSLVELSFDVEDKVLGCSPDKNLSKLIDDYIEKNHENKEKFHEDFEIVIKLAWLPEYIEIIGKFRELIDILDYSPDDRSEFDSNVSLESLIENFSVEEKLTSQNMWFCPKCKTEQLAQKQIEIYRCPNNLIIHLKRFKDGEKIDTKVDYNLTGLDMSKYTKYNDGNMIYDLYAVVNHYGGLHGGHYTAYGYNYLTQKWYEYNDSWVRETSENSVIDNSEAYVLFYRKRNGLNQEALQHLYTKPFVEIFLGKKEEEDKKND